MKHDADHPDLRSRQFPVQEDMAYQLKVWRFERIGWYLLVLCMLLGLLGLFSRGVLSSQEARSDDGKVQVEYEMFHRNGSTNPLKLSVHTAPEATVELDIGGEMLDGFRSKPCSRPRCVCAAQNRVCACGCRLMPRARRRSM
ncbi:hypothetical protein [Pseudomonas siliginis]|uniref:hypothetical protein n=1 Tax=Pseudomonas siliginis TaxID=2842346 RepID=UPI001CEDE82E|nr:hypothetical protein [Pseudomonas siliginis]